MRVTFALLLLVACANARNHQAALHPGYVPRSLEKLEQQIASSEKLLATKEGVVSKSTYDTVKKTLLWLKKQRDELKNPAAAAAARASPAGLDGPTSEKLEKLERRIATSKQKISEESTTKETTKAAIRKLLPKLEKQRDELLKAKPAAAAVAPPAPSAGGDATSSFISALSPEEIEKNIKECCADKLSFSVYFDGCNDHLCMDVLGRDYQNPAFQQAERRTCTKESLEEPECRKAAAAVAPPAPSAVNEQSSPMSENAAMRKLAFKIVLAKFKSKLAELAVGANPMDEGASAKAGEAAKKERAELFKTIAEEEEKLEELEGLKAVKETREKIEALKGELRASMLAAIMLMPLHTGSAEQQPSDALFLSLQESGLATNPKFNLRHY